MTDYKKSTGSSGTMMIRDTGSVVEFWINSGNSTTFANQLPWGYTVNGTTNNDRESTYSAGAGWVKFGSWTVTTDQTVTFRIFDTGTSGFGGPTTFSQAIDRASVPSAPTITLVTVVSSTQINVTMADGANNGAAITARQFAVNTINTTTTGAGFTTPDTPKIKAIYPLNPGTLYYFWARTENAKGWSAWSPVKSATTFRVADTPNQPIVSDPTQTSVVVSFTDNGNGGTIILERQIGYYVENDPTLAVTVPYTGVMTIDGLQPGVVHYFWARVRNSAGWSPWSPVAVQKTIAGAWVWVGGVAKEAVPYVRDGGVWKLARPWGRVAGVWKETT